MSADHSLDHMASLRVGEAWYASTAMLLHVEKGAWLNRREIELAKLTVAALVKALAIQEQRLTGHSDEQRAA